MLKKMWKNYSYAIILIALSFVGSAVMAQGLNDSNEDYLTVTVDEDQSLWELAEEYSKDHSLPFDEFVKWVENKNGILGDRIYPGDELVIPVDVKEGIPTELASTGN